MTFVEVRCPYCEHLLCKVSKDFYGLVETWCRYCKTTRTVSIAVILKQLKDDSAILPLASPKSART